MLKLKNVCKFYKIGKEKKVILDNITLDFNEKGLVFILGASGSGKSTLLNIISGNLACDSGEVWFGNVCITSLDDKKLDSYRYNIVGNIFQDYNLIDYMDVWDNVMLGYNGNLSKVEKKEVNDEEQVLDDQNEISESIISDSDTSIIDDSLLADKIDIENEENDNNVISNVEDIPSREEKKKETKVDEDFFELIDSMYKERVDE